MPFQKKESAITTAFTTIKDLAPTFLELAKSDYPEVYNGKSVTPYQGESMLPLLTKKKHYVHENDYVMGWELFGRCALRKGKWKIVKIEPPFGTGVFQLYNIEADPTESVDLRILHPDQYNEMLLDWEDYVKQNGVILVE
jgi:arylsulfatase A-like enzyme